MASHDLDVPGLGQHLVIAPQVQLPLAAAKKHPLEVDAAVEKSPRSRRVKKSRLGEGVDIAVARTHGGSSEHDELDSDQVGGDEGGDDDDFVDPSLKQVKPDRVKRFAARAAVVHSPPRDFAHNTGAFMNLPLPSRNHSSNAPNASVGDYTHISQALAHQPLATNPSQQTMSLLAKLSSSASMNAGTEADRVTLFMEEMRAQIFGLSQRMDVLETSRFVTNGQITAFQVSLHGLESRIGRSPLPAISLELDDDNHGEGPSGRINPVSDAANADAAATLGAAMQRQFADAPEFRAYLIGNQMSDLNATIALNNAPPPVPLAKPRRSHKKLAGPKKESPPIVAPPPVVKRGRKPELSRAVRVTMFRLLGLTLATNAPKFHGYASQPALPDFSSTISFDSMTGARLWRWEWDKTIRQSAYNSSFAIAIQNQVIADKDAGHHDDVPEDHWYGLEEAVDSAYTNLRRERESQVDPGKKLKKDEHKKRGKKRGLKEEKCKRRVTALKERLRRGAASSSLSNEETSFSWIDLPGAGGGTTDDLAAALEIKYMSSEEEVETRDPELFGVLVESNVPGEAPSPLVPGEKTFSLHRPAWRSERLARGLVELDSLRPPERTYRRIMGIDRSVAPPPLTPDWMVSDQWRIGEGAELMVDQTLDDKGKGPVVYRVP